MGACLCLGPGPDPRLMTRTAPGSRGAPARLARKGSIGAGVDQRLQRRARRRLGQGPERAVGVARGENTASPLCPSQASQKR